MLIVILRKLIFSTFFLKNVLKNEKYIQVAEKTLDYDDQFKGHFNYTLQLIIQLKKRKKPSISFFFSCDCVCVRAEKLKKN